MLSPPPNYNLRKVTVYSNHREFLEVDIHVHVHVNGELSGFSSDISKILPPFFLNEVVTG